MRRVGLALVLVCFCTKAGAEGAVVQGSTANGGFMHSYSSNHETQAQAVDSALSSCSASAFNCYVLRQINNTCFAMAYGVFGGYGFAFGANAQTAKREAVRQCRSSGNLSCNVVAEY